jgi:tRNA dimethylallyltransferase
MESKLTPKSLVVLGPTASGKTKFAVELAYELSGEIISIDSRMVFKKMDIGTGKDLKDYFYKGKPINYHLIDIVEPWEEFNIYKFQEAFKLVYESILERKITPILVGGSGLYLEAVIQDFVFTAVPTNTNLRAHFETYELEKLVAHFNQLPWHPFKDKADIGTCKRAIRAIEILSFLLENPSFILSEPKPIYPLIIGLNPPLEQRRTKIIEEGLIEEVEGLLLQGLSRDRIEFFGLEYKWVLKYIEGNISKEEMIQNLGIAIQQFAKRQMTYFRKMEKSGLKIHWIEDADGKEKAIELIKGVFKNENI